MLALIDRGLEALELLELIDGGLVQLLNLAIGLFPNGLLVIGEEKSSELTALEEVFALILLFRHRQDVVSHVSFG